MPVIRYQKKGLFKKAVSKVGITLEEAMASFNNNRSKLKFLTLEDEDGNTVLEYWPEKD